MSVEGTSKIRKVWRLTLAAGSAVVLAVVCYIILAVFGGAGHHVAYATSTCTVAQNPNPPNSPKTYTANISLDGTSSTLGQDSSGDLLVDGNPCGNFVGPTTDQQGPVTAITLTSPLTSAPQTTPSLDLDQTQPGGMFPCSVNISGNLNFYSLQVNGTTNEHVIVGTTGVDLNNCGAAGTFTGKIQGYVLVGSTNPGTEFDARGSTATGGPVAATFQAGDSTSETFDAGKAPSILDFSQLSCPAGSCTIVANSTGSTVGSPGVAKFQAALASGSTLQYQINYTVNEADFTEVIGNADIPTTFFAPASSTAYTLDGDVTLQGAAGTYTVTCLESNNQISAGAGTETFNVTGSNVTLVGGSGKDTFSATGANNDFQAGAGADTFSATAGPNTIDFSKLDTTTNPLSINTKAGTATLGTTTYTFQAATSSSAPFSTFLGATSGHTTFQTDSTGGLAFQGAGTGNSGDFSLASHGVAVNLSSSATTTSSGVSVNPGQVLVSTAPCPCLFDTLANVGSVTGFSGGANTFWGGAGTVAFNASGSGNLFNGSSGGTYNIGITGTGTNNQAAAGAGSETFNVTGNGVTLLGGSGTGTFTDTGKNNTFMAGSGPDSFYDSTGPNTVNFTNVGTSPTDQLAINAAGAPEQETLSGNTVTVQYGQAVVGSGTTYTFLNSPGSTSAAAFTGFVGASTGSNIFVGGAEFNDGQNGGVNFNGGPGGGNSLSFPTVTSGMTIQLSGAPPTGTANVTGNTPDSVSGITTVTGSPQGGNTFTAGGAFFVGSSPGTYNFTGNGNQNKFTGGAGADVFTSSGSNNVFVPGSGTGTFNDTGTANTVDFSNLTAPTRVVVNVTGGVVGSLGTDQATATFSGGGTTKYFFSGFGANGATFIGAQGTGSGTTFFAGSTSDVFEGHGLPSDTLSFADVAGTNLQFCVAQTGCTFDEAVLGTVAEPFSGIEIFDGLSSAGSTTTFLADDSSGGYTFTGLAGSNTADFSAATDQVQANVATGQVTFTAPGISADNISDVNTVFGSASGGNTFVAGTASQGNESFGDRGKGTLPNGADTVNFSNVPTVSGTPLNINASGAGTSPFVATFGSVTYNFSVGGPNFTSFTGANGGFTNFVAGATSGYTFNGLGGANSVDFSAVSTPITANLSTKSYGTTNPVGADQVALRTGPCPAPGASPPAPTVCDNIADISTVTGSLNGGNTFVAGGPGQAEMFKGGSQSAQDTVDFSNLSTPTVVNVSQPGQSLQSTAYGTATSNGTVYDFTNFVADPVKFVGDGAGTTFFAGSNSGDSFVGQGLPADTLSFADAPGTSLQVCVAGGSGCSAGEAVLGTVDEFFSGVKIFDGLGGSGPSTTFLADDLSGGYTFTGVAGSNTADFSAAAQTVQANLGTGRVTFTSGVAADTITNITTVFGSARGGNTFTAGTSSETFADRDTGPLPGGDTIDFSNVPTLSGTPLNVNASGAGTSPFVATFGSATYTFATGGANFTNFIGPKTGFTTFEAGAAGGYRFQGQGGGNSADFSADFTPIIANLSAKVYGSTNPVGPGQVALDGGPCPTVCDTIANVATLTGSLNGGNTFVAGGPGQTETFKGGANNTVDFSKLSAAVKVNVTGGQVGSLATDEATATFPSPGGTTQYFFTGFGASDATFVGSTGASGGTTFFAGPNADNFTGQNLASDTLNFTNACTTSSPCLPGIPLQVCVGAGSGCAAGEAVLGNVDDFFSGIKMFDGLSAPGSTTTFAADDGSGGYTFVGNGVETNTADFSNASKGITAKLNVGTVSFATAQPADSISGISTIFGSTNGGNTFIANPSTGESFGDNGTAGGDNIDFSHLLGSTSANPLTVNSTVATSTNGTPPFTATLGTLTYSFGTGATNFTGFTGSLSGSTDFVAPSTSGLSFVGQGFSNTADFSSNLTGVTADMVHQQVTFAGVAGSDLLQGSFASVIGSPVGKNTFDGALTGTTFTASNSSTGDLVSYASLSSSSGGVTVNLPAKLIQGVSGSPDSFRFGSTAPLTVEGSPAADTFQVGTTPATIEGGGGTDIIDLTQVPPPASGTTSLSVDLNGNPNSSTPAITGPTITGGVKFTAASCTSASINPLDLCVSQIIGSTGNDTFIPNAAALGPPPGSLLGPAPPVSIIGNGGTDILNLGRIPAAATIDMPITSGSPNANPATCNSSLGSIGAVCAGPNAAPGITFSGLSTVIGTQAGGDHFFAGSGSENLTETGPALGVLDFSVVPSISNVNNGQTGITVDATDTGGSFTGTVDSPLAIGVKDSFFGNFGTFIGTVDNDTFMQNGPAPSGPAPPGSPTPNQSGYIFEGGAGTNNLDLSLAPASTIDFNAPVTSDGCTGPTNNDGTVTFANTTTPSSDSFTCMASVSALSSEYQISPGQSASVNGGGQGTLKLVGDLTGNGVTVTLPDGPNGTGNGTVTGDGYNFSFTGMATVYGTPFNDVFVPGTSDVALIGSGGNDWLNYTNATNAADVNLSGAPYTIPKTATTNPGTVIPANTAIGGNGGLTCGTPSSTGCIGLTGISNVTDSAHFDDVVVGGSGSERLVGGQTGADTFLPTGGNYVINGGSGGDNTIDLSLLPGSTSLYLWSSARQVLGTPQAGTITLVPGTIQTAVASPGGSVLEAGNGNDVTLMGGSGNDTLVAGIGTQTLEGMGGNDVLVAGSGDDTLIGGNQPVTFMPGQGGQDTLESTASGNTLSYGNVPVATPWKRPALLPGSGALLNLSGQDFSVPAGEPFAGASVGRESGAGAWGASVTLDWTLNSTSVTTSIGNVVGSPASGVYVVGSSQTVTGSGPADLFVIDGGNNHLNAPTGSHPTFLFNGTGSNTIKGGGSGTVDFSQAPAGVQVDLQTDSAMGGFGGNQTLSGILNITGSQFSDFLIAAQANATIIGLEGNDTLEASAVGGDTLKSNGGGNDTFCAQVGCKGMPAAAGGNTMIGGPGNNLFCAQNNGVDTINGGGSVFSTAYVDAGDKVSNVGTVINKPGSC